MKEFEGGVDRYTVGTLACKIGFPFDRVRCQYCPFCRSEHDYNRFRCLVTNEILLDVFHTIGYDCPIEFEKDGKEEK